MPDSVASSDGRVILPDPCRMSDCFIHGEPPLQELLSEPIVQMTARRDGLSPTQLRQLIEEVRERLRDGDGSAIAV